MTANGWLQIALYCVAILVITRPLGGYLAALASGANTPLSALLQPVERRLYALCGISPTQEQGWLAYATAIVVFSLLGFLITFGVLCAQQFLPWNPDGRAGLDADLAYNTAISFLTNTNWQSYGGETTMSHGAQMMALTVQNFLSAATGIAVSFAFVRGLSRRSSAGLGNFWVDLVRIILYLLLPLSILLALVFVWQGVPQTLSGAISATTLEGARQTIALGPVASQEAIKFIGTNGGGFFNVNSAHPFENPTALTNFLQTIAIFALAAGLTNMFGRMVGNERQGWAVFTAMAILFLAGVGVLYYSETLVNPALASLGLDGTAGNMEGKEVRFGAVQSALFAAVTTAASCGAVNSMIESFLPLGGMVALVNMMLGEIIFGGVGAGLYGFLMFAIIAVFVAGLMVGRTPEFLGKKIEAREIKMTMIAILCLPTVMLGFTALAVIVPAGVQALSSAGPHGFSEALYAYVSAGANNGSAFAGIASNTPFFNITLGIGMMIGRFFVIIPALAIAGSMAAKRISPPSAGTFPTDRAMFVGLVIGVIVIVGGLTFFPALALGPLVEHFALRAGALY